MLIFCRDRAGKGFSRLLHEPIIALAIDAQGRFAVHVESSYIAPMRGSLGPRILAGIVLAGLWAGAALWIVPGLPFTVGAIAAVIVVTVATGRNPFTKRWW